MALKEFHCERCEETFKEGSWNGCGGDNSRPHIVEPKLYYVKNDNLIVHYRVAAKGVNPDGKAYDVPDGFVYFMGGQLVTDDPQVQVYMETKFHGLITREQYEESRLSPELRNQRQKTVIQEQKNLLERQKAELEALRKQKASQKQEDPPASGQEEPETASVGRGRRSK